MNSFVDSNLVLIVELVFDCHVFRRRPAYNRIGTAVQRGISGGQKRRVTLGASLVTLPRILFLDEPTSGLDSRTSYEVMSAGGSSLKLYVPSIYHYVDF